VKRLLVFALLCACSRDRSVDARPDPSVRPTSTATPKEVDERFACTRDEECRLSCAYGAVSATWYAAHARQECKDGCASAGESARCLAGSCVAFRDGVRDDRCTGPGAGHAK
jgi:hypothetical protein